MDPLERFFSGQGPGQSTKIDPEVQRQRDEQARKVLNVELQKAQKQFAEAKTPEARERAGADIVSLQRELGRSQGAKIPAAAKPTQDPIEAFFAQAKAPAPAAPAKPGETPPGVIPGWPSPPAAAPAVEPGDEEPKPSFVADILQRYVGPAYRTARQVPAYVKGGLEAGVKIAEQTALLPLMIAEGGGTTPDQQRIARARQALSGYKVGPEGQQILETMGDVLSASKLPPYIATTGGPTVAAVQAGRQAPGMARETMATWKRELEPGKVTQPLSMQEAQAQFAAKQQAKPGSIGAQMAQANPYAGVITGEEYARGIFPQVKLSKTPENVPVTEQAYRAQIANDVLGGTGNVRPGVVTGNESLLRTEYTLAKDPLSGPKGDLLRKQIADEQVAITKYAEDRVKNTGASQTLLSDAERGERINSFYAGPTIEGEPPRSLIAFFKEEENNIYKEARQRFGDNPIKTASVDAVLSDPQFLAGLKFKKIEGVAQGAKELIDLARNVGITDVNTGQFYGPNTIAAWDAVKKANNAGWTQENAAAIRRINTAIDRDIAAAGGGDLLKRADAVHQAKKTLLGSKGIKDIFGEVDPNGVATGKTPFDNIPKRLNQMPVDQWRHIYDVADRLSKGEFRGPTNPKTGEPKFVLKIPESLRLEAEAAKAEILGALAREVYQAGAAKAGVWNQNSVNDTLNARQDKIRYGFPLEEQQAFHKLNYAGYLMPGKHDYEGAALQARRIGLIEQGLEKGGAGVGAATGGYFFGTPGAAVGTYVGTKAGQRAGEKLRETIQAREAKKLVEEMKKTSKLSELLPK